MVMAATDLLKFYSLMMGMEMCATLCLDLDGIQRNSPKNWVLSYILPPQCQRVTCQQQRSAGFMNVFVESEQVD